MNNPKPEPAKLVEYLYKIADHMAEIEALLSGADGVWRNLSKEREADLEKLLGDYDFFTKFRALRGYADDWQYALDMEGGHEDLP